MATYFIQALDFLKGVVSGELTDGENLMVEGDVDLRKHPLRKFITQLPRATILGDLFADGGCALKTCHCNVKGEVNLDGSFIEEFAPKNIGVAVMGEFSAKFCGRLKILKGAYLSDVSLDESGIEELGADFSCIKGKLSLEKCTNLRRLDGQAWSIVADRSGLRETGSSIAAENFSAEECEHLKKAQVIPGLQWAVYDGSGILEVEKGFSCGKRVSFLKCNSLKTLTGRYERVEVSGAPLDSIHDLQADHINFSDCESLPDSVTQFSAGRVGFIRCPINQVPHGIPDTAELRVLKCSVFSKMPTAWKGDIKLSELPSLKEFGHDFQCDGSVEISDCDRLLKLNGVIGNRLSLLSGSRNLRELDRDLVVKGDLHLFANSFVKKLNCQVLGGVTAPACDVVETGAEFVVRGEADFRGNFGLLTLKGRFSRDVMLDDSAVRQLGADFECSGDVFLRNTKSLNSLNCFVEGNVIIENSSLSKIGPAFHCGKNLKIMDCPELTSILGRASGGFRIDDLRGEGDQLPRNIMTGTSPQRAEGLSRGMHRGQTRSESDSRRRELRINGGVSL